jgi:hypothetical protein
MSSRLAKTRRLPASASNGCDVIASLPHSSPDNRDLGPENDFMAPPIIRFAFELIPCPKVGLTSLGQPRLSEAAQPYPDALVALPTANRLPPPPNLCTFALRTARGAVPTTKKPSPGPSPSPDSIQPSIQPSTQSSIQSSCCRTARRPICTFAQTVATRSRPYPNKKGADRRPCHLPPALRPSCPRVLA